MNLDTNLIADGKIGALFRARVTVRLSVLGPDQRPVSLNALCRAWDGIQVNQAPALVPHHLWTLLKSDSPRLREVAQLASMMGVPTHLLVCDEAWRDSDGRSALALLNDLDAYPVPPPVASFLSKAD